MSNIIDIESIGWKSEQYEDSYLGGETHQHLVKVADYVKLKGSESPTATTTSELQFIGAYEYAPGGWITAHLHTNAEQWYFVLNGRAVMKVGDEEREVGHGTIVFVPRNAVHSYQVVGEEPLRILNIATWFPGEPSVTKLMI